MSKACFSFLKFIIVIATYLRRFWSTAFDRRDKGRRFYYAYLALEIMSGCQIPNNYRAAQLKFRKIHETKKHLETALPRPFIFLRQTESRKFSYRKFINPRLRPLQKLFFFSVVLLKS